MELKQNSSTKSMINLGIQNFIPFLVLYLSLLKTEEYQRKGGIEMEQDPMVLAPHVLSLLFFFKATLFIYLFIYLIFFSCVGSSFLCEGFL